jgi:hypothetical protein
MGPRSADDRFRCTFDLAILDVDLDLDPPEQRDFSRLTAALASPRYMFCSVIGAVPITLVAVIRRNSASNSDFLTAGNCSDLSNAVTSFMVHLPHQSVVKIWNPL